MTYLHLAEFVNIPNSTIVIFTYNFFTYNFFFSSCPTKTVTMA